MVRSDNLGEEFLASGRRLTRQRRLVLDVLKSSQEHLDAESLYERAKAEQPNISLATVYRTLQILKELGLVQEHQFGEGHAHFETTQETPHYHFTCSQCGRVIEFDAPQIDDVLRRLSEQNGLLVTGTHLLVTGRCAQCREGGDTHSGEG